VYSGNIRPYVEQKIANRFSAELVKEVPIVSAINILKKTVDSRAGLYKSEPERGFTDLSEDQEGTVGKIYNDMRANFSLLESNKLYELQKQQTHLLIEPKRGRLIARPIKAHQVNVVPSEQDPEVGEVYIFSGYNEMLNTNKNKIRNQDNNNQKIADYDDYKGAEDRYIVWSKSFHFVMNGNGAIVSGDDIMSPLAEFGIMPIVEISAMKDFSYWREETNDVAEFCVDYNMHQSMLGQICELQGFSQAVLTSPENLMPSYVEIGPNRILKLVTNPAQEGDVKFEYVTPSSDIASVQAFNESLLAQFLSSQGLDSNSISGQASADKFSSGVERLLAQIEKFEGSKETMAIYRDGESHLYNVVKAWHNALKGTGVLLPKYETADLPMESEVLVKYSEPQTMLGEIEKLDIAERRMDIDWDVADAAAFLEGVTREEILASKPELEITEIEEPTIEEAVEEVN